MAQHSGNLSGKVCINCSCPLEREDDSVTAVSKPNKQIDAHGWRQKEGDRCSWSKQRAMASKGLCEQPKQHGERERYGATDRPTLCNRKRNEGLVVWYSGYSSSTETWQSVREAVSYRELFIIGWFGMREKYYFRLEIYDRLRSEQAESSPSCPGRLFRKWRDPFLIC